MDTGDLLHQLRRAGILIPNTHVALGPDVHSPVDVRLKRFPQTPWLRLSVAKRFAEDFRDTNFNMILTPIEFGGFARATGMQLSRERQQVPIGCTLRRNGRLFLPSAIRRRTKGNRVLLMFGLFADPSSVEILDTVQSEGGIITGVAAIASTSLVQEQLDNLGCKVVTLTQIQAKPVAECPLCQAGVRLVRDYRTRQRSYNNHP